MKKITGRVVYRARALGPRPWVITWGILATVSVLPPFFVDPYPALWQKLAMIPIYAITWGCAVWIVLLTLWSINRYADITVTDEVLRVGREVLPLDQIEPRHVRRTLARLNGTLVEDPSAPPTTDDDVAPVRSRHMGGAYASTVGARHVIIGLRNRDGRGIDARDPAGFLTALASVLPER